MELPPPFRGFPTRENCDPNDPFQAFLWMLVALPYQNGAQLVMPVDYLQLVSKRLWDCGVRPSVEPVVKYRPPAGSEPNWMTSPGRWVDADTPDPDPKPIQKALESLTAQQKAELLFELKKEQADK
jgi:hypothetical protein